MSEDKGSLEEALGVSSADAAIDFNAGAATAEELTLIAELKEDLKVYFSLLLLIKKPFREREREHTRCKQQHSCGSKPLAHCQPWLC